MTKRISGTMIIFLGLVLILTPWYIFPVCGGVGATGRSPLLSYGKGRYAPKGPGISQPHKCANTAKAETILGILTIGIGAIALIRPSRRILILSSGTLLILACLVALFPLEITGLCKMSAMPCRMGTLPALIILAILMALTALGGMIQGRARK